MRPKIQRTIAIILLIAMIAMYISSILFIG